MAVIKIHFIFKISPSAVKVCMHFGRDVLYKVTYKIKNHFLHLGSDLVKFISRFYCFIMTVSGTFFHFNWLLLMTITFILYPTILELL